jgi:hypothetical protein
MSWAFYQTTASLLLFFGTKKSRMTQATKYFLKNLIEIFSLFYISAMATVFDLLGEPKGQCFDSVFRFL